jgi:acyl-CoA thioester hydrolase
MIKTHQGVVYPWECDHMGHMNVMWYAGKFDEATWNLFAAVGLTPAFLRERGRGMAAVRQTIEYKSEFLAGDIVVVHSKILEIGSRMIRFLHEMTNGDAGAVAATTELTGIHLDLKTRRPSAFSKEILERGRGLIVSSSDL